MKKTLIALAFVTAGMAAVPAFAQTAPTDNSGWFVGAKVGQANLNKGNYDGSDTGYAINGGYRWSVTPNTALGLEAGYNDLGNIKLKNAFNSNPVVSDPKSKLHGWTFGANGKFNFTPNWYATARAGIYQWKGHGISNDQNPLYRSLDKTDWYGGVGFGYDFTNNFSLGLNYDYYQAKKDHLNLSTNLVSVGAEYRF
ncbi:porin family protein [Oleiagrimonas soli]|uniref:Autotransporter n=1 Tax=Oleiagrimonas soli TaxID=1543381 RepID=A0A099CZQ5_9GAMM|nr:porin family protein [Oleiagrimonas soli]KGI78485.1 autotransporter [Oleiagrimonas soli]MBB6184265.1 OOP family OmpA-OmpF porin/outer membrane immunogenic protein [Oleiagrimonas soli]